MKTPQFGIRSTVYLYDCVVDQNVHWERPGDWAELPLGVPTVGGKAIAEYRWAQNSVEIRDVEGTVMCITGEAKTWTWANTHGARVEIDRIQMQRARRRGDHAWGDVALLVMMLTLMVGIAQLNMLFRMVVGERVEATVALEPSPELIARYLRQEFGGEARGSVAHVQRSREPRERKKLYLPAGSAGPMDRSGGGAKAGDTAKRRAPTDKAIHQEVAVKPKERRETLAPNPAGQPILQEQPKPEEQPKNRVMASVERFVGWGFHDWLDVPESGPQADNEMRERLQLAREIMRVDPDDPFALLTVSYYAYLSENHALCRDLYKRYIELYPEDAAGWNNLALSYKRTGEYAEEEDLYRVALALEPNNSNTKNNLAVNLAHQGRYVEAHRLMDELSVEPEAVPYAELHHAKIAAAEGRDRKAYRHLKTALSLVDRMDTFHHIEFRQDIRLDPSFSRIRNDRRFRELLHDTYGQDSPLAIRQGANGSGSTAGG